MTFPDTVLSRRELGWLLGITAIGGAIRLATLDVQSRHHDEAVTATRIILPNLSDTLQAVGDGERSPPLHYVLAWAWSQLFGSDALGLRSLSALIGTLTIPAVFLAARDLAGRAPAAIRIGLVAASFAALNPYLVWYSQEARPYALLVLFAALALAFFARSARGPTPRNLALWAAASAAALVSHYFAIFFVLVEALWLVWTLVGERRRVLTAVAAVAAVAAALAPLAIAQEGDSRRNGYADAPLGARVAEAQLDYFASEEPDPFVGSGGVDAVQSAAALGGATLLLTSIWLIWRRGAPEEREAGWMAAAVFAGAAGLPILLAILGLDFVNPRNFIAGVTPMLCLAGIGFGGTLNRRVGQVGAIATCVLFTALLVAVNLSAQMQRENWRGAAEAMGTEARPRLVVTNANGDDPLVYYLGAEKFEGRRYRQGVKVSEILVLSTNCRVDPPRGFRLASREVLPPLFILQRFASHEALRVHPQDLSGRRVLSERSAVLLDTPG